MFLYCLDPNLKYRRTSFLSEFFLRDVSQIPLLALAWFFEHCFPLNGHS